MIKCEIFSGLSEGNMGSDARPPISFAFQSRIGDEQESGRTVGLAWQLLDTFPRPYCPSSLTDQSNSSKTVLRKKTIELFYASKADTAMRVALSVSLSPELAPITNLLVPSRCARSVAADCSQRSKVCNRRCELRFITA